MQPSVDEIGGDVLKARCTKRVAVHSPAPCLPAPLPCPERTTPSDGWGQ
jgi:hypothetical protein